MEKLFKIFVIIVMIGVASLFASLALKDILDKQKDEKFVESTIKLDSTFKDYDFKLFEEIPDSDTMYALHLMTEEEIEKAIKEGRVINVGADGCPILNKAFDSIHKIGTGAEGWVIFFWRKKTNHILSNSKRKIK